MTETLNATSPTKVIVDLGALADNYQRVRSLLPPSVAIAAVVKTDAYGHGIEQSSTIFHAEGCRAFCVASAEEALRLRMSLGEDVRILKMVPSLPDEYDAITAHHIEQVIASAEDARLWIEWLTRHNRSLSAHLKIDRGMGRLGFGYDDLVSAMDDLFGNPCLHWVGVMSHLPASEEPPLSPEEFSDFTGYHTSREVERFRRLCMEIEDRLGDRVVRHMANSGAILFHPDSHFDWVRPGLSLYGADPRGLDAEELGLRPALALETQLVQVRTHTSGGTIGYGRTFRVHEPARVGVIPIGYADGVFRKLAERGSVLVEGRICPILGRVSMNLVSIDLTSVPSATLGTTVTLIGENQGARISVEEVAVWAETIPYEILTSIGRLAARRIVIPRDPDILSFADFKRSS